MSCLMTNPTKWHVRPAKTQISLGIRPARSESSLCAQWIAKGSVLLHADMRWLWDFTFEPPHDKTNKMTVRPSKTQISLGIHPAWSESSLCAQWIAKGSVLLHADSEDSDQTGRMPRLIWVFAGRTVILLVLSWGGSNVKSPAFTALSWWI